MRSTEDTEVEGQHGRTDESLPIKEVERLTIKGMRITEYKKRSVLPSKKKVSTAQTAARRINGKGIRIATHLWVSNEWKFWSGNRIGELYNRQNINAVSWAGRKDSIVTAAKKYPSKRTKCRRTVKTTFSLASGIHMGAFGPSSKNCLVWQTYFAKKDLSGCARCGYRIHGRIPQWRQAKVDCKYMCVNK